MEDLTELHHNTAALAPGEDVARASVIASNDIPAEVIIRT